MHCRILRKNDLASVLDLFCECFSADHYYQQLFADCDDLHTAMRHQFENSIDFCLDKGEGVGIIENGKLIAYALYFDYNKILHSSKAEFNEIFGIHDEGQLPYYTKLHYEIENIQGDVLYLLSIAVSISYQQRGLASGLIDYLLQHYSEYSIVSDVSNKSSLSIYKKRNFQISEIIEKYYYVAHKQGQPFSQLIYSSDIQLLVPNCDILERYEIDYSIIKENRFLVGYEKKQSCGVECFIKNAKNVTTGIIVSIDYVSLLKYQRLLNIAHVQECSSGDVIFYEHRIEYSEAPLFNQTLIDMVKSRSAEWSLIPDVFVSIPVQYCDINQFVCNCANTCNCADDVAKTLLVDMDFRTHYEAGVPSSLDRVDDLASIKTRIKRFYLGKLKIQIFGEITPINYETTGDAIGPASFIDLYISVDTDSNCAVLTWYSLSTPFLISHLFDSIIRNQIIVVDNGYCVNFYDYIKDKYGLIKRGTPKIFSVFPCDRKRLTDNQLASLLACETIYPEGENFGKIIDESILSKVQSNYGMGQYDRAFVYAYSNSVLQFSEDFSGSISERLCEESITLFYIELILFEEAAIHIADREIINLVSLGDTEEPVEFLSKVDAIYDSYSKTIDFWDIKVNYPTSQKSIKMLRNSFEIKDQLDSMKRNQDQLQTVFDTKCDIIDRKDSKRMDTSLAIISVLVIFSAWIDGYDYIATWSDILSQGTIHILQRILFFIVLVTAGYAVTHLFGNKVALFLKNRRRKNRRRGR